MLQRIEPPIDGRRGALDLALVLNELRHVAPGDGTGVLVDAPEKQPEIPPIMVDGVGRIVPPMQIGVVDCNRNGSGLPSTEIWDHIRCIYPSLQDGIMCH